MRRYRFTLIMGIFCMLTSCTIRFTNIGSVQWDSSLFEGRMIHASSQNVDFIDTYNTLLTTNGRYTTKQIGKNRSVIYIDNDNNETVLLKKGWYCNLQVVNGYLYATDVSGSFDKPAKTICLDLKDGTREILEGVQNYCVFDDNGVLYYKVPESILYYKGINEAATIILENCMGRILVAEGNTAIIQEERNHKKILYLFQDGKMKAEREIPNTLYELKICGGNLYFFVNEDDGNDNKIMVYREEINSFFTKKTEEWGQLSGIKNLQEWYWRYSSYIVSLKERKLIEEKCENVEFMPVTNSKEYVCFLRKKTDTIMLYENRIMINDEIIYYKD